MEPHLVTSEELPLCLTWARDLIYGEAPAEEYIAGTWNRDGKDILLRIRFYDRRQKREHISIYEVRGERGWGEEFLIFEKPADFSYPPSGAAILRHLEGIVVFPATLRLQWAAREGLVVVAAASIEEGANPNEKDRLGELPLDALAAAARKAAGAAIESLRLLATRGGGDEEAFVRSLASLAGLHEIRSCLLAAGAKAHGPFRQMVRDGNFEEAQAEFDEGVQIDTITPNGTTLLIERILHRDEAAVAWLLDHGADPNWDGRRKLPVHFARTCPHINPQDSHFLVITPFSTACIAGFPEGIDLLVKAGSKFGWPDFVESYEIFDEQFFPDWVKARLQAHQPPPSDSSNDSR